MPYHAAPIPAHQLRLHQLPQPPTAPQPVSALKSAMVTRFRESKRTIRGGTIFACNYRLNRYGVKSGKITDDSFSAGLGQVDPNCGRYVAGTARTFLNIPYAKRDGQYSWIRRSQYISGDDFCSQSITSPAPLLTGFGQGRSWPGIKGECTNRSKWFIPPLIDAVHAMYVVASGWGLTGYIPMQGASLDLLAFFSSTDPGSGSPARPPSSQ